MAPKKKQAKNAFFFFMMDFKKRQEAKGLTFPGGWKDASNACNDEWQKMTPQQKGPYESRAKDEKVKSGVSGIKYTSQGVPISLIEKEAKRKQDFEDNMNDYIKVTVNMAEHRDSLANQRFYFIHVNWLCRKILPTGEGDFYPAEFAVAEFSLQNGIQNTYHEIINIDIPMGYTFEVALHSDETHKIGKNPPGGQSNFGAIFQNLTNLLRPETIGKDLPPLYTTRGVMEIVPGLLTRVAKAAGRSVDIFRVYSIETLFFHIRNAAIAKIDGETASAGFPSLPLAVTEIQKDRFDRAPGIACEYHIDLEEAAVHCSKSIVIRWAYTICDFCCLDLDIEMQPGSHCPLNTDIDFIEQSKEHIIREALNFKKSENICGLASTTGVTEEYRVKTSERTYREEQERRQRSGPLQIIDYSKVRDSNRQEVKNVPTPTASGVLSYSDLTRKKVERDLRMPKTKMRKSKTEAACPYSRTKKPSSYAMMGVDTVKVPNMDDMNFPAIGGRGIGVKRNFENDFPPIGRGSRLSFGN